jgi:ribosome-associated heat shock protein Hsp15
MDGGIRIDKWLWAVRVYKTRSQATEACRSGKVRKEGLILKASYLIKKDDVYEIRINPLIKTMKVKEILDKRVSARLAVDFMEDLTPREEYDKLKIIKETHFEFRERGTGRPTKKQRRLIDYLKDE